MGVKGLQTFMEGRPTIFRLVDIGQMAADYWEKHPEANSNPVIVVDGNNCLQQGLGQNFCENQLDWVCGGQWDEYLKALGDFIAAFERIGVKLVFFFDGLIQLGVKLEKWLAKRHRQATDIEAIFENIKNSIFVAPNIYTVAPILSYALRAALKYIFKATVYYNVDGECDHSLASFAAMHQCMAILAQDTDYVIYPTAPYISMLHLDLKTMHSRLYCREALCREVGINEWMLPLFACMVGTDDISRESLKPFHARICKRRYIKGLPLIHTVVRCVVDYIKKFAMTSQADMIKRIPEIYRSIGMGNAVSLPDFKKAIEFYSFDSAEIDGYRHPEVKLMDDENDGFYDILVRKVKNGELLPTILNVICSGRVMHCPSLEDAFAEEALPPCVLVYRPLRERMYGLMFELKDNYFDKSMLVRHTKALLPPQNTVEEWWVNPSKCHPANYKAAKDIVSPLPVELTDDISNATVLHDIIMENEEYLLEKKWAVFRTCLGLTISTGTFESLPLQHKSLCAILNYLIQEPRVSLKLWEIEAFIVQAVHPKFVDSDYLGQLQPKPYNSRAVNLATLFLRGVDNLFDLFWFCGNPVEMDYVMPWHFFNGKLFHQIYKDMQKSGDGRVDLSGDQKEKFQQLKDAILEGIDMHVSIP